MSTRTSSRQAAVKANEALQHSQPKKAAGRKRKDQGSEGGQPPPAKAKRAEQEEPHEEKPTTEPAVEEQKAGAAEEKAGNGVNGGQQKEQAPPAEEKKKGTPEEKVGNGDGGQQKQKSPPAEEIKETAVQKSEDREQVVPSNILEKGIIYFFYRPRVSVEEPGGIEDVARSFIVLRPLPRDATLGEGPIGDEKNCRLMVLPKKKLPTSSRERYMGFVEKAGTDVKTLRESFLGKEYETKTKGEQHQPSAAPLAEGVYAITSTDRSSHLVYILTIPSEPSEVQTDFGLKSRGSFIVSIKNPKFPGPSAGRLPKAPEFPEELMEELRDLRWAPLKPKFLDFPSAQFLLIGEAQEDLGKSAAAEPEEPGKVTAGEEVENLEHENEVRAYPLRGDDTVFDDLGMSMDKYPKVRTTWE